MPAALRDALRAPWPRAAGADRGALATTTLEARSMAAKPAAPVQTDLATRVVAAMMQGSVGAVVGVRAASSRWPRRR